MAGELLHVSGVIATVTAGLICGWYQHVVFSASTRIRGIATWQVLVFLLEAAVFLLIGSSLRSVLERVGGLGVVVQTMGPTVLIIVLAVTLARFAWVFGSDLVLHVLRRAGREPSRAAGRGCRDGHELGRHARSGHARGRPDAARRHARARPDAGHCVRRHLGPRCSSKAPPWVW